MLFTQKQPKPANVTFPKKSAVSESASNSTLQNKGTKKIVPGKGLRGSTATIKKSSTIDKMQPASQRPCGSLTPSASICHKNPVVPVKENVVEPSRQEHLGSRGNLAALGYRQRGASLLHRSVHVC